MEVKGQGKNKEANYFIFSELSKSLDSLLNDVGSHRDSNFTASTSEVAEVKRQGRDRRSVHALGITGSEASIGDSQTTLPMSVQFSSTSSVDSDLIGAQVFRKLVYFMQQHKSSSFICNFPPNFHC